MQSHGPSSRFIISLDFELHWGVFDKRSLSSYRENLGATPIVVDRLLRLFERTNVHATWATVGLLACENKEHALSITPKIENQPAYRDQSLSAYPLLDSIASQDERFYFAPDLVRRIIQQDGQEFASHTFAHIYTLEAGITDDAIQADIDAMSIIAKHYKVDLKSVVFPRNQFRSSTIDLFRKSGIRAWRGQPGHWSYAPRPEQEQSLLIRGVRLADHYLPVVDRTKPLIAVKDNVPATMFLRPYSHRLRHFEPLRLRRILAEMRVAAYTGRDFHLWWHPHNFGANIEENFAFLESILKHYQYLRDLGWMRTATMSETLEHHERA